MAGEIIVKGPDELLASNGLPTTLAKGMHDLLHANRTGLNTGVATNVHPKERKLPAWLGAHSHIDRTDLTHGPAAPRRGIHGKAAKDQCHRLRIGRQVCRDTSLRAACSAVGDTLDARWMNAWGIGQ